MEFELPTTYSHIQPKLEMSKPGDIFEKEADRVAEQVMRMSTKPEYIVPINSINEEKKIANVGVVNAKKSKKSRSVENHHHQLLM